MSLTPGKSVMPDLGQWLGRIVPRRLVLTFHGLGRPAASIGRLERPYWVDRSVLAQVLDRAAADPAIEITFDDGNVSDMRVAFPLIASAGQTATFFILAGRLDEPGYLTRRDVGELVRHGMRVGNHGHDHIDWTKASDPEMRRELYDARHRIEDAAGAAADTVSVPYGAFDARVLRLVAEAGYSCVHTSSGGLAGACDWLVTRNSVRREFPVGPMIDMLSGWRARLESGLRAPARRWKYGLGALNTSLEARGR
jgi:peptidoglycan/xylan/chitin deacetylase (PgdA/CDA1 family)